MQEVRQRQSEVIETVRSRNKGKAKAELGPERGNLQDYTAAPTLYKVPVADTVSRLFISKS